jgi:hypothetical protein
MKDLSKWEQIKAIDTIGIADELLDMALIVGENAMTEYFRKADKTENDRRLRIVWDNKTYAAHFELVFHQLMTVSHFLKEWRGWEKDER